jgi:hypothetical protein
MSKSIDVSFIERERNETHDGTEYLQDVTSEHLHRKHHITSHISSPCRPSATPRTQTEQNKTNRTPISTISRGFHIPKHNRRAQRIMLAYQAIDPSAGASQGKFLRRASGEGRFHSASRKSGVTRGPDPLQRSVPSVRTP